MHFEDNIATSRYILDNLNAGITIFLKASRSMKFEEIIENLKGDEKFPDNEIKNNKEVVKEG